MPIHTPTVDLICKWEKAVLFVDGLLHSYKNSTIDEIASDKHLPGLWADGLFCLQLLVDSLALAKVTNTTFIIVLVY